MDAFGKISADQIMERIRREVARRKGVAASSLKPVFNQNEPTREKPNVSTISPEPMAGKELSSIQKSGFNHHVIYSVHDFSKYHDAEFIENAYRGILKRDPDPQGFDFYITKLRQGARKGEILGMMRYSKEGRQRKVAVRGLLPLFLAETSFGIPVLGYVLETAASIAMLPKRLRYIRQWESFTSTRFAQQSSATNVLSAVCERNASQIQNLFMAKADNHLVEDVKGRLATKADAGIVFELQQRLETKAESRVVEQMTEQLKTKADGELIERMRVQISTKADTRAVDEVGRQLAKKADTAAMEEARGELATKANRGSVEELRGQLARKADAGIVFELQRQLEAKAESGVVEQIGERLRSKADISLVDRMSTQISTKADAAMEEVRGELARKADKDSVEDLRGQLGRKSDAGVVFELQKQLETKAESGVVEQISERLQAKADIGLVDRMRTQISTKADTTAMEELRRQLGTKAEASAVDDVKERSAARIAAAVEAINKQLAYKADADAVNSLKSELNSKADAEVMNAISKGLQDISRQTKEHKRYILDQQRRLSLLLEEARKRFPEPIASEQLERMISEEEHLLDAVYVAFEDQFRGTREDIKQRLRVYLPLVENVIGNSESATILDVGCGRGEWLEVLRENNYRAKGVDRNRVMIQQCSELDLDVIESDALEYVKNQKGNRFRVITGFHIVEHIPFKVMLSLLDESLRLLNPGGMIIFETPNPENLIVGSCSFYLDPTHRQPIPPAQLLFMVEQRGFVRPQIMRLHPKEEFLDRPGDHGYSQKIQSLFSSAQDYSIIAYKPASHSGE
jgi:2-polyprenyl-3-methyl-5-hydroxy-6-metoxy-1,4-benzoquinol methylase